MRTRAGMRERVKKGLWMGGGRVPWGYYYDRNDGILHVDPDQAEMVRKAYEMYIDGMSCINIARMLGFKSEGVVSKILKRKSNIGMIEYNGGEYKGLHEPIVSEEIFYKAAECMKRRTTNSYVANDHILTGLCWCGRCGAKMRYQKWGKYHKIRCYSQDPGGKEYMIKDPNCDNEKVIASWVEDEVEDCFKRFAVNVEERSEKVSRKGVLEHAIEKSNSKVKKLYRLYAENENDNLLEVIQEEEAALKGLKEELRKELEKKSNDSIDIQEIRRVADVWDTLTAKEKNRVLKACVEKVVIDGEDIEVHFKL